MGRRKTKAKRDRLSNLPDEILIHILSKLENSEQVVRCSVLSTRWRFLWTSVPISLEYHNSFFCDEGIPIFLISTNRDLYYWRSSHNIRTFELFGLRYKKLYVKDFDLWVHFATKVANVEGFTLEIDNSSDTNNYKIPQFAYKSSSLKNLALKGCRLKPASSVNWSNLVSLSIVDNKLTDAVMETVLSGCPNLEHLKLDTVWGIRRFKINSAKLRELILIDVCPTGGLEIFAPYVQTLELSGVCLTIHFPDNVPSLITASLDLSYDFQHDADEMEEEISYLKEILHSVAHVKNLELGPWCIECLSLLELEGWQSPPSSRKFLKFNAALEQLDFPGIFNILHSSSHLQTLVIDWYSHYKRTDLLSRYINEDEQGRRFQPQNFKCSLLNLKTIKIINYDGPLSQISSLVKYLLKNATVLEKFSIATRLQGNDVSQDHVKMEKEFLRFPRSSPHASIVFSYR